MTFGEKVINFYSNLSSELPLPSGIDILFPFSNPETWAAVSAFYHKFYGDRDSRIFIFGINPGRFGAGITGIPFTDPVRLEEDCGIPNSFGKKPELSAVFVYECIHAFGGVEAFYKKFYITSLSPLGFIRSGKNCNYYDDRILQQSITPFMTNCIRQQIAFGTARKVAFCLGQGKNMAFFEKINAQHQFFDTIIPLPHPRWVMQYKRKQKAYYTQFFLEHFTKYSL